MPIVDAGFPWSILDPWNEAQHAVAEKMGEERLSSTSAWRRSSTVTKILFSLDRESLSAIAPGVGYYPWRNQGYVHSSFRCGQWAPTDLDWLVCQAPRGHVGSHACRSTGLMAYNVNGEPDFDSTLAMGTGWVWWENTNAPEVTFSCDCCGGEYDTVEEYDGHIQGMYSTLCLRCADRNSQCDDCNDLLSPDARLSTTYGYFLCRGCMEDRELTSCIDCGEYYSYDDYDVSDGYCPVCTDYHRESEEDRDADEWLHDYSFSPTPEFQGEGRVYMGWELETEVRGDYRIADAASVILDTVGEVVYLKEDSSINRGFEMVSHPMTHEFARNIFPWKVLNSMSENGCYTQSENNGLHVHVNRTAFDGPSHIFRWLKFLYRNSPRVTQIARRNSSHWAKWGESSRLNAKTFAKGRGSDDRYSAVNVNNPHTFEVRVFAASLNAHEIMAALDLVHASVEYTRTLTSYDVNRGGWTWTAFRSFLDDREDVYSSILRVLQDTAPPDNDVVPVIPAKNPTYVTRQQREDSLRENHCLCVLCSSL